MPSFGGGNDVSDSRDVGFGGGGSRDFGAGISDRDAFGGSNRDTSGRRDSNDFSQAVNYADLSPPSQTFTGLSGGDAPVVSATRAPSTVASYDALAGPDRGGGGGFMSTGFDPWGAVAGIGATLLTANPLLGALAYRGVDAARGWFNGRGAEEDDITLGDLFDFDSDGGGGGGGGGASFDYAAHVAANPGEYIRRDDGFTQTSQEALARAGVDAAAAPLPATETPAAPANKYAERPDLVYGPYFNYATGAFDAPGGRPYDGLVQRYGVNTGG